MGAKDGIQLLADLKKKKHGRRLEDLTSLLRRFGWAERKASRENSLWKKGTQSLTLPNPHGGDKVMKVCYVVEVIRKIEAMLEEEED